MPADLPSDLRPMLESGLTDLGLDTAHAPRLLAYLALLVRWNATYNLTAIRDPREMVTKHLLDSLAMHAFDLERRVQPALECVDRVEQRAQAFQRVVLALHRHQHAVGRGQVDVAGQQVEVLGRAHDGGGGMHLLQQHVGGRGLQLALVDAAAHGGVALRVEVDQQHLLGRARERRGQVDRRGGLADSAFLVRYGDDHEDAI